MESQKTPVTRHVINTTVEHTRKQDDFDLWWVQFKGSRESLAFPDATYSVGDQVKITFEKVSK